MKNTSSLLLTLVSYLIVLATILFMLFAAIPVSLKAQTNVETGTNSANVTNAAAQSAVGHAQVTQPPSLQLDVPGVHMGGAYSPEGESFTRALALMIPIVAIVMGCSIPIVIVALSLYFCHRKQKMLHETVRAMVEKGVPIPPELFKNAGSASEEDRSAKHQRGDLKKGVILTCVGIGIVLLAGKPGWIVLFLGVAFLVIALFEKKNKDDNQPPKP